MLHVKFQNHRPSGSGEEDFLKVFASYSHGGHLGYMTWAIYINYKDALPDVWLSLAKRFQRRRPLNILVIYMYIPPGWWQTSP